MTWLTLPPAPGLSAEHAGDAVRVTLSTGDLPAACQPKVAYIVLDDEDAAYPPYAMTVRLTGADTQTFDIVPIALRTAPVTAQASLGLEAELRGPSARIVIRS